MKTLGERVKDARLARGFSQDELAKLSGYTSRASINKIELNKLDPPRSKVDLLARALHVTPAWLLGFADRDPDALLIESKMVPVIVEAQDATEEEIRQAARYLAYLKTLNGEKK